LASFPRGPQVQYVFDHLHIYGSRMVQYSGPGFLKENYYFQRYQGMALHKYLVPIILR